MRNSLSPTDQSKPVHGNYHLIAFIVSSIVLCCLIGQFLWQTASATHLAMVTLAAFYTLIRFIQLLTLRKQYPFPALIHGAFIVCDQIYLAMITLAGTPALLTLSLSGVLLYAARTFLIEMFSSVLPHRFPLKPVSAQKNTHENDAGRATDKNDEHPEIECLQRVSENTPAKPENDTQRILILSKNDNTIHSISRYLRDWGYEYTASRNCAQALKHMLSRRKGDHFVPYNALIVDQHKLDIDPCSLVGLIRGEEKLADLQLICLKQSSEIEGHSQRLIAAGYTSLLKSPINKAQLFGAIMGEQQYFADPTNVVRLSLHRDTKKKQLRQGSILLADSPSTERTLLGKKLIQSGYLIRMVDNGDEALDALEEGEFNLAVINIKMPVMSGTQVIKLHRYTTPYKNWVPFIFITDENTPDTLRLCRSIGVQACLFKPVTADDLLEMIPTALDQHQSLNPARDSHYNTSIEHNITHFQHSRLLDHMTLLRLEQLDNGITFTGDLFKIFEAEGQVILRTMRRAIERNQLGLFLDHAQILLDSAGQLGAFVLYELNQQAIKIQANEFKHKGPDILEEIEETFNLTLQAFNHYLSQRTRSHNTETI